MFKNKDKTIQCDISDDNLIYHYRQMTREQRDTIDKQDKIIKRKNHALRNILELTEANRYGNGEVIFGKINELAKTAIQN